MHSQTVAPVLERHVTRQVLAKLFYDSRGRQYLINPASAGKTANETARK